MSEAVTFEALLDGLKFNKCDDGACKLVFEVPQVYADRVMQLGRNVGWYFPIALGEPVDPKAK